MSVDYHELSRLWLVTFPEALFRHGNDVSALIESLGLDEEGFHRFTDERGAAMRAAGKRNGLSEDHAYAVAVTHGFILGLMLAKASD